MRTAKFVARKQWVVAGADDMFIRVYNHNTMEKIKSFEAHTDYIRCSAGSAVMTNHVQCSAGTAASLQSYSVCASTVTFDIYMHLMLP